MRGGTQQKVRVVPMVSQYLLQSNGVDTTEVVVDVPSAAIADWGPHLMSITAHTGTEAKTTNFRWKAYLYWSLDGVVWSSPTELFAWETNAGSKIQNPFTDAAKLGLHIRVALVGSPTNSNAREQALVTLVLVCEFKT